MTHIDDAVNFGRSMGLKVAAGLQSMAQLYDVYGKDKGLSIAAGFSSVMAFRSNDWLTTEYVRDAFGLNYLSETTLAGSLPSTERREGHVVEAWEVSKLKPGEAFIRIIENSPFKFKFPIGLGLLTLVCWIVGFPMAVMEVIRLIRERKACGSGTRRRRFRLPNLSLPSRRKRRNRQEEYDDDYGEF